MWSYLEDSIDVKPLRLRQEQKALFGSKDVNDTIKQIAHHSPFWPILLQTPPPNRLLAVGEAILSSS